MVDIDNFVLENGLTLIEAGVAQQTFLDGKFSVIKREIVEEYSALDDDEFEEYDLGNLDYFSVSTFYGMHSIKGRNRKIVKIPKIIFFKLIII